MFTGHVGKKHCMTMLFTNTARVQNDTRVHGPWTAWTRVVCTELYPQISASAFCTVLPRTIATFPDSETSNGVSATFTILSPVPYILVSRTLNFRVCSCRKPHAKLCRPTVRRNDLHLSRIHTGTQLNATQRDNARLRPATCVVLHVVNAC